VKLWPTQLGVIDGDKLTSRLTTLDNGDEGGEGGCGPMAAKEERRPCGERWWVVVAWGLQREVVLHPVK